MTKTFKDLSDLNSTLAFDIIDALTGIDGISADFGSSNISESAYVNVNFYEINEGADPIKLRFSCHGDRHGSDFTFRTDADAVIIYSWMENGEVTEFDEDGEPCEWNVISKTGTEDECPVSLSEAEFDHVEFPAVRYDEIIAEAVAMATKAAKEI